MKFLKIILFFLLIAANSFAQDDTISFFQNSPVIKKPRVIGITASESVIITGSLIALSHAWYEQYSTTSFHTFNDWNEWEHMDKAGHVFSASYLTEKQYQLYRWADVSNKRASIIGAGSGFLFLSAIELLDGYSAGWGASGSDMVANVFGCLFSGTQLYYLQEMPLQIKYSFHKTKYAQYRPALLGTSFLENLLKDYNGQTYWLTINAKKVTGLDKIPSWIGVSLGFGAEGMLGGKSNPVVNEAGVKLPTYKRYNEYYLSLDIDLQNLLKKPSLLKSLLSTFSFVKVPFPAISVNRVDGMKFYPVYF